MAVFVGDNTRIKVAIPIRIWRCPKEHLHPGAGAIGGGSKIGIVRTTTILGFGLHRVVAKAATAVVVHLKVATGFIKAVAIQQVVGDVVPVEQIGHGRRTIGRGGLGQVKGKQEIKTCATVRARTRIGGVAGIRVGVGVNVIAFGGGKFGPRRTVGIMPAKGRGSVIGRLIDSGTAVGGRSGHRVNGAFDRLGVDLIATAISHAIGGKRNGRGNEGGACIAQGNISGVVADCPVDLRQNTACRGIHRHLPPVAGVNPLNDGFPCQNQFAVFAHHIDQFGGDGIAGNAPIAQDLALVCPPKVLLTGEVFAKGPIEFLGGRVERFGGR